MSLDPESVCTSVLDAVRAALKAAGRDVGSTLISAGGFAVDDCCAGMLVVTPERIYQARPPFPTQATTSDAELIALDLIVSVARCVPVIAEDGTPPTTAEQTDAHRPILRDAAIVWDVCTSGAFAADPYDLWERGPVSQDYIGPDGGCVLMTTRFAVGVPIDEWCLS